MKKKTIKEFALFLTFSLGAGVIEFGTFTILVLFFKSETMLIVAEVLSVALSCIFNFTLNRKYTFKSSSNVAVGMLIYGLFYLITTPLWAAAIVFSVRKGMNEIVAKTLKMLLNFVLDFAFCKFVLFKKNNSKINMPKN